MSDCSNCKLGSPDQVKSKGGPVYNELFDELKPYRLEYDKTYFFFGNIFYDRQTQNARCSLILNKDKLGNVQYLVQIFLKNKPSLFKPFTGVCLNDNRGIISNQNGFTIQYTTVDQSLYFYTTNSNDLMGKFILEDVLLVPPGPPGPLGVRGTSKNPGTYYCGDKGYGGCKYCNCGQCNNSVLKPGYIKTTSCGGKVCESYNCDCSYIG